MKSGKHITSDELYMFLNSNQNWISTVKSCFKNIDPKICTIASLAIYQSDENELMRYMDQVFHLLEECNSEQEVIK